MGESEISSNVIRIHVLKNRFLPFGFVLLLLALVFDLDLDLEVGLV